MEKRSVLFLCTANSARSVMAEEILNREVGDQLDVSSAGLDPKPVHPLTVEVLREIGIDVSGRKPRSVSEYLGKKTFHYVISVCKAVEGNCPIVWPFALQHQAWPFPNPTEIEGTDEQRLAAFRSVRDEINTRLKAWVRELKSTGELK